MSSRQRYHNIDVTCENLGLVGCGGNLRAARTHFRALNCSQCAAQDPEADDVGAGEQQAEELPCKSLGLVGWGGNLRAMRTPSEEVAHLDHLPFRPALLSQPGSRWHAEHATCFTAAPLQKWRVMGR